MTKQSSCTFIRVEDMNDEQKAEHARIMALLAPTTIAREMIRESLRKDDETVRMANDWSPYEE